MQDRPSQERNSKRKPTSHTPTQWVLGEGTLGGRGLYSPGNLVCGAPAHYLESTAFGAMISVPHWTFFVVERIKESFCSGRQLHHSPLLQSAGYTQVLLLSV